MKNILVVDAAENCVYDVFAALPDEYSMIFLPEEDIAFIDEVLERNSARESVINQLLQNVFKRRVAKIHVQGIHGTLFYDLPEKKKYYPTRRDEEAISPNESSPRKPEL